MCRQMYVYLIDGSYRQWDIYIQVISNIVTYTIETGKKNYRNDTMMVKIGAIFFGDLKYG